MKIKFKEWNCILDSSGRYFDNGRVALELLDEKDGEPIAVATVNIPSEPLEKDEVIIKDYSENDGMLYALVEAGVLSAPIRFVSSGFVLAPVCKLLIKPQS